MYIYMCEKAVLRGRDVPTSVAVVESHRVQVPPQHAKVIITAVLNLRG